MRLVLSILISTVLSVGGVYAQHPSFGGVIQHHSGSASVVANGSRPLYQAITAVREEYGWLVDYEDPPYQSHYDVGTIPWPAHPGSSWSIPASGSFQSSYPETSTMWSSTGQEGEVLSKIVFDYNQSGNPGNFAVQEQADGSYAIVGNSIRDNNGNEKPISPILETPISISSGTRDVMTTVGLITGALSQASGVKVVVGVVPINIFLQSTVTIQNSVVPARNLLLETIAATPWKMVWDLLYDPQFQRFVLNASVAMRAHYDAFGNRNLFPVKVPRPSELSGRQ